MQPEQTQSNWQIAALTWFETHKVHVAYAGAAALAVWFATFTYKHVRAGKEAGANAALAALHKPADRNGKQAPSTAGEYLKVAEQHAGTPAANRALLFAADRFFSEGKHAEAKAQFEKYLAANASGPTAAIALMGVAACQEAAGETDKAVASYQQLLAQHGSSPEAHPARLALALLHEQKKQPDQALRLYDEVSRAKPVTVWRMEAEMRRDLLLRQHPQLAGTFSSAASASSVVAPAATNAPAKK